MVEAKEKKTKKKCEDCGSTAFTDEGYCVPCTAEARVERSRKRVLSNGKPIFSKPQAELVGRTIAVLLTNGEVERALRALHDSLDQAGVPQGNPEGTGVFAMGFSDALARKLDAAGFHNAGELRRATNTLLMSHGVFMFQLGDVDDALRRLGLTRAKA